MVRLIENSIGIIHDEFKSFNSKMVRLIAVLTRPKIDLHLSFQFQNGTIDSYFSISILCQLSPFQFQNGTIDSAGISINYGNFNLFQFQNGTIDRLI